MVGNDALYIWCQGDARTQDSSGDRESRGVVSRLMLVPRALSDDRSSTSAHKLSIAEDHCPPADNVFSIVYGGTRASKVRLQSVQQTHLAQSRED
jgi:hypothetical protein